MTRSYAVLGRVARRIWAVAMRDKYGANDRSQKLKYQRADLWSIAASRRRWPSTTPHTLQALNAL